MKFIFILKEQEYMLNKFVKQLERNIKIYFLIQSILLQIQLYQEIRTL